MGSEELNFLQEAFESNYIAPVGPMVDAFEREFAEPVDILHALAVCSGTAPMHVALRALVISVRSRHPGDSNQENPRREHLTILLIPGLPCQRHQTQLQTFTHFRLRLFWVKIGKAHIAQFIQSLRLMIKKGRSS
jgi:hypothetical protein